MLPRGGRAGGNFTELQVLKTGEKFTLNVGMNPKGKKKNKGKKD